MVLVGDRIKQVKKIIGFDYVGMEFEVVKVEDNSIIFESEMGRGCMSFGEFEAYFEKVQTVSSAFTYYDPVKDIELTAIKHIEVDSEGNYHVTIEVDDDVYCIERKATGFGENEEMATYMASLKLDKGVIEDEMTWLQDMLSGVNQQIEDIEEDLYVEKTDEALAKENAVNFLKKLLSEDDKEPVGNKYKTIGNVIYMF